MSIIDQSMEFCDDVEVAAATGTALVGDVVQLPPHKDLGSGYPLYLVIGVSEAFASAGAATVEFVLATDAQAAIATNGSATEHLSTGKIPFGQLTAGAGINLQLPSGSIVPEEYLGILVRTAGAATTAGTINAYLTFDPPNWKSYPEAIN